MTINLTSTGWEEDGNISIWTTKRDIASNASFNDSIGIKLDSGEIVDTLAGDDAISGTGGDTGIAMYSGTIRTGDGKDTITGIAGRFAFAGLNNQATIQTGSGNDSITGFTGVSGFAGIFNSGIIETGDGSDTITATGGSVGIYNTSNTGGIIETGDGNDTITGTGSDTGIAMYSGRIQTGSGNDIITGTSTGDFAFAGLDNRATIQTGDGNDIINGVGGFAGILNSSGGNIKAGDGNDTITGTGIDIGIFNASSSTIQTENGNDIITGAGNSMGIRNFGTIQTGDGNDTIIGSINGVSQAVTIEGGGAIKMGLGKDLFQGFGNMFVYGDDGTGNFGKDDTLNLGSLTFNDFQSQGSISKTGAGDNFAQFAYNGIVMTTTEFDQFIFADKTVNYSQL